MIRLYIERESFHKKRGFYINVDLFTVRASVPSSDM